MIRLTHAERHLCRRRGLKEELCPLLHLLLTSMTQQEIADELGPGYTPRLVAYRAAIIFEALFIPPSRQHLQRVALLRLVTGLDSCYCEPMRLSA